MKDLKVYTIKSKMKLYAIVMGGVMVLTSLTGCNVSNCNISDPHAHGYISDTGIIEYKISENKITGAPCSKWTEKTEPITEEVKDMNQYYLARISDNIVQLKAIEEAYKPEIQYEKSCIDLNLRRVLNYPDGYNCIWVDDTNYPFMTGYEREDNYLYHACKMEKDKDGFITITNSPEVLDITQINSDEFPYFSPTGFVRLQFGERRLSEEAKSLKKK